MKKLVLLVVVAFSFMSCEKDEINEPETAAREVVGTWELYRDENLESVLDEWTGTEWTTVDQWFQNTREDSQIILDFREDGTFDSRYANVVTSTGVWGVLNDGRYYFDFSAEDANSNDQLMERRFVTMHCDNTYSIEIGTNERRVDYYRIMGTTECSELITYNVE